MYKMSSMMKEASLEGLEFDGETVLCRVCGDKASGFHYGVHACEGCKGFFRRSIQQKIQYRPCLKNQQCNIQRVNRNRCQYCRLKKCISVGMSRDAVRFGRVPKKEKARIIEQMQKQNSASQSSELNSLLSNSMDIVQVVVNAHRHTCDVTQFRAHQMRELALHNGDFVNCPAHMACPLNNEVGHDTDTNRHNNFSNFSESFTPAIKSVVDFAKGIPGFTLLNQDDQVTLLKAGTFEVLLVRLACLFDPNSNTMMFTKGKLFRRQPNTMTTNAGFLLDSMFDFAERFNKMCLIDDEIAMFSAVVLMSPDRPGIRNLEQVERIQNKLTEALQNIITANHTEDPTLFAKLLMKTTDLRTLNTLHSEKSIAGQRNNNGDDSDMDLQDSISTRSGRSSPTLSETSNMTMTSGYSGDTDSSNLVVGQRLPIETSGHQQVVLRTPYGTFFREEMSGFYGMMADQPRRRCNTLDRDTLSRPRLHTIEEGNKRRYTMDRDYMKQLANRLDHLECRGPYGRGDSMPPSISNSTTSSPIQEEGSSSAAAAVYATSGKNPASTFPPTGVMPSDLTPSSTPGHPGPGSSRTSPLVNPAPTGSSPASPKSRSRSGSFSQEDYNNMRPRCYSFHLNSEGRAARMPIQHRMQQQAAAAAAVAAAAAAEQRGGDKDGSVVDQLSPDNSGGQYLTPEMRRGSVGTAYGLHSRKSSLLVDRPMSYLARGMDNAVRADWEKRAARGQQSFKHLMTENPMYGMQLTPDMAATSGQHPHPGLWHPHHPQASAALALGLAAPPHLPIQVMNAHRQREEFARSMDAAVRDWEAVAAAAAKSGGHVTARDLSTSSSSSSSSLSKSSASATATLSSKQINEKDNIANNNHLDSGNNELGINAFIGSVVKKERDNGGLSRGCNDSDLILLNKSSNSSPLEDERKSGSLPSSISVECMEIDSGMESSSSSGVISRSRPKASSSPGNSSGKSQNSPEPSEDSAVNEKFTGHKKFDKFRKSAASSSSETAKICDKASTPSSTSPSPSTLSSNVKEEKMEEEEEMKIDENNDDSDEEGELKIDDNEDEDIDVKCPIKKEMLPQISGNSNSSNGTANNISPVSSNRSSPSPNGDRPKLSAKEAHPNLLAHLMNGGSSSSKSNVSSSKLGSSSSSSSLGPGFPWAMPVSHPFSPQHQQFLQQQQQQHQMFKLPGYGNSPAQANNNNNSLSTPASSASSSPSSSSSSSATSHSHLPPPAVCPFTTSQSSPQLHQMMLNSAASNIGEEVKTSLPHPSHREEFHAVAVSHLKDKLMRKFDSMENLTKIDPSNTKGGQPSPNSKGRSPINVPDSRHEMALDRSPSSGNKNSMFTHQHSTTELNKELATKLTLSSTTHPPPAFPVTAVAGFSPTSSSSTAEVNHHPPTSSSLSQLFQNNNLNNKSSLPPPSLSQQQQRTLSATPPSSSSSSPLSKSEATSNSSSSSPSTTTNAFMHADMLRSNGHSNPSSSPSAPPTLPPGLAPMLLSQGIHPATLPMYHSMLSQQYSSMQQQQHANASMVGSIPARSNTCSSAATTGVVIPPLANMQHFAQMYARGVTGAPGLDKRFDMSNVEETSNGSHIIQLKTAATPSPSHSPQTPA